MSFALEVLHMSSCRTHFAPENLAFDAVDKLYYSVFLLVKKLVQNSLLRFGIAIYQNRSSLKANLIHFHLGADSVVSKP
jgi:hypothetical protein